MLHVCQLTWWRRFHNWFSGCDTEKMRMAWMAWMARDPLSHPGYSRIILHLVGGLEHDFYNFPYIYIGNFIIPTDELTPSFFRGVGWNHQPEIIEISFIQWPFQEPKLEVPTICKAYTSGLCKGISPQNMAKHMVLTYLHFRILFYSHW